MVFSYFQRTSELGNQQRLIKSQRPDSKPINHYPSQINPEFVRLKRPFLCGQIFTPSEAFSAANMNRSGPFEFSP